MTKAGDKIDQHFPRETQEQMLAKQIDKSLIKQRQGAGGKTLDYIPGYVAIDQANKIFGFGGWSYSVTDLRQIGSSGWLAVVKVTANVCGSSVTREDTGWGSGDSEKASKEAVTDALKRALRTFGDAFGNWLWEKPDHEGLREPERAEKPAVLTAEQKKQLVKDAGVSKEQFEAITAMGEPYGLLASAVEAGCATGDDTMNYLTLGVKND